MRQALYGKRGTNTQWLGRSILSLRKRANANSRHKQALARVQKLWRLSQTCSFFSWQHEGCIRSWHCPTNGMAQLKLVLDNQMHLFVHGRHFDQSSPRQTRMNLTQVHICNAEARLRLKHVPRGRY